MFLVSRGRIVAKQNLASSVEYTVNHMEVFKVRLPVWILFKMSAPSFQNHTSMLPNKVFTPNSSAACGQTNLEVGKDYLLAGISWYTCHVNESCHPTLQIYRYNQRWNHGPSTFDLSLHAIQWLPALRCSNLEPDSRGFATKTSSKGFQTMSNCLSHFFLLIWKFLLNHVFFMNNKGFRIFVLKLYNWSLNRKSDLFEDPLWHPMWWMS